MKRVFKREQQDGSRQESVWKKRRNKINIIWNLVFFITWLGVQQLTQTRRTLSEPVHVKANDLVQKLNSM